MPPQYRTTPGWHYAVLLLPAFLGSARSIELGCAADCGSHAADCALAKCADCSPCIVARRGVCNHFGPDDDQFRAKCVPWCHSDADDPEGDADDHCSRCACQACDFCGGASVVRSDARVGCAAEWCDPAFPTGHCPNAACEHCAFCAAFKDGEGATSIREGAGQCKEWCDSAHHCGAKGDVRCAGCSFCAPSAAAGVGGGVTDGGTDGGSASDDGRASDGGSSGASGGASGGDEASAHAAAASVGLDRVAKCATGCDEEAAASVCTDWKCRDCPFCIRTGRAPPSSAANVATATGLAASHGSNAAPPPPSPLPRPSLSPPPPPPPPSPTPPPSWIDSSPAPPQAAAAASGPGERTSSDLAQTMAQTWSSAVDTSSKIAVSKAAAAIATGTAAPLPSTPGATAAPYAVPTYARQPGVHTTAATGDSLALAARDGVILGAITFLAVALCGGMAMAGLCTWLCPCASRGPSREGPRRSQRRRGRYGSVPRDRAIQDDDEEAVFSSDEDM